MASSSTGRVPQGEVIMDFADGGSYVKQKLENAVLDIERRRLTKEEGAKAQKAMAALDVGSSSSSSSPSTTGKGKSEDVDFIVSQLGTTVSKEQAEQALTSENGDLVKALLKLVQPRRRARSVDGTAEIKS